MRNRFAFCLQQVTLYLREILNSIDFYKRIFLHVTDTCITFPWYKLTLTLYIVFPLISAEAQISATL